MIMAQVFSDFKRPTVAYCGNAELSNGASLRISFPFSGMSLGDEGPRRTIVVGVARRGYNSTATASITIGSTSATQVAEYAPAGDGKAELWSALVPSGLSATITVTMAGVGIEGVVSITVWALYDLRSSAPILLYGSVADPAAFSLASQRHSIILSLALLGLGPSLTSAFTWSGIASDYSQPIVALGRIARSAAHMTVTSVPSDFSVDYATPTNQRAIAASFR